MCKELCVSLQSHFNSSCYHDILSMPCVGKQGDVLWGQRLHYQECDRVPDASGQVRWRLGNRSVSKMIIAVKKKRLWLYSLCVLTQGVNGTGGQGERHDSRPQCSSRQEEGLLQVKYTLSLMDIGVVEKTTLKPFFNLFVISWNCHFAQELH